MYNLINIYVNFHLSWCIEDPMIPKVGNDVSKCEHMSDLIEIIHIFLHAI